MKDDETPPSGFPNGHLTSLCQILRLYASSARDSSDPIGESKKRHARFSTRIERSLADADVALFRRILDAFQAYGDLDKLAILVDIWVHDDQIGAEDIYVRILRLRICCSGEIHQRGL